MDCRVKPGNDALRVSASSESLLRYTGGVPFSASTSPAR